MTPEPFLSERDWNRLIDDIALEKVVPVVGPEIVTLKHGAQDIPVDQWVAQRLATMHGMEYVADSNLDDFCKAYFKIHGVEKREHIFDDVRSIMRDVLRQPTVSPPEFPEALKQLAAIAGFKYFICTTFDPLLLRVLKQARPHFDPTKNIFEFDGESATSEFAYDSTKEAVLYPLGSHTSMGNFAIWEEDYLEFFLNFLWATHPNHPSQSISHLEQRISLSNFWKKLKNKRFLILGSPCRNVVIRLLIRAASGGPIADNNKGGRVDLCDHSTNLDVGAKEYLTNYFSNHTRVIVGSPKQFIHEMHQRWLSKEGQPVTRFFEDLPDTSPVGAVFISYARDDLEIAKKFALELHQQGVNVWIDNRRLTEGTNYETSLEYAVRTTSSFFISLISQSTETKPQRYVHNERRWAAQRHFPGRVFYIPVVVDETRAIKVEPECFKKIHYDRTLDGQPSRTLVARLKKFVPAWKVTREQPLDSDWERLTE